MKLVRRSMLVWLVLVGDVHAQVLYRCVGHGDAVSWQSRPCGNGARMQRRLAYSPEPPTPVNLPAIMPRRSIARVRAEPGRRGWRQARAQPDACLRARTQRAGTLARIGLKRTYDLLSKLDAEVWRACR